MSHQLYIRQGAIHAAFMLTHLGVNYISRTAKLARLAQFARTMVLHKQASSETTNFRFLIE